jgi:hypothetical protein
MKKKIIKHSDPVSIEQCNIKQKIKKLILSM